MKATLKIEKEFELKTLEVKAKVRYWEDTEVNGIEDTNGDLIPCRKGDLWCPIIDIDSGKIINWEDGKKAVVHYKVCDCCGFDLKDENGEVVLSANEVYVPSTLSPKESGYGDYIIMDINEDGKISDWQFDINDFIYEE